jgi:hypothetical protein
LSVFSFVFVSTVGTSILQPRVDKAKDQKVDDLVSGNKELLDKVGNYQLDLQTKDVKIKALETSAKKASRGITSTYAFNGAKRDASPGQVNTNFGEEYGTFQRMVQLQREAKFVELKDLCEEQIEKTPDWLTPYLFLGAAYLNLGDREKGIANLEYVVSQAASDPDYAEAAKLLEEAKSR